MAEPKTEKKPFNLGLFAREVRSETAKVTWPARKEVAITTGMVIWMAIIAAIYLFVVDFSVQHLVRGLLNLFA